jgi:TonB family protein
MVGKLGFRMLVKVILAFYIAALISGVSCANAQEQSSGNPQNQPTPGAVFKSGKGVTPPRVKYAPDPEFSEKARVAGYQGTCTLSLIVDVDGKPRDIKVVHALGMGLDEKAIEAVRAWRFEPGRKDGKPVAVQMAVEVDFHLYGNADTRIAKLTKRADAGDAKAELDLATAYFDGQEVPKDEGQGLTLLEKAARQGLPRAQFLMGEHVIRAGTPTDYASAYMWYTLAQRGGYRRSDKVLKKLAPKMTAEQLQAGQALVSNWTNAPGK